MSREHYCCWLLPVHRVLNAAILAAYRRSSSRRTHAKRVPSQYVLWRA